MDICVFCGSSAGVHPSFAAAATQLGNSLSDRGIGIVYGGASVGLMGVLADAALGAGGRVTGVITETLAEHEIAHPGLFRLEVVSTMHQRKSLMYDLCDAVIMLPGGFGTYEEFFETATWVHLGIHHKRCWVLNVDGFFDGLLAFLDHAVTVGFIHHEQIRAIGVYDTVDDLIEAITKESTLEET